VYNGHPPVEVVDTEPDDVTIAALVLVLVVVAAAVFTSSLS
jgi:hypothetical protein